MGEQWRITKKVCVYNTAIYCLTSCVFSRHLYAGNRNVYTYMVLCVYVTDDEDQFLLVCGLPPQRRVALVLTSELKKRPSSSEKLSTGQGLKEGEHVTLMEVCTKLLSRLVYIYFL